MLKRKPKRVYVLGAGPAGLLAAHAAEQKGYEPTVFSKPDQSGKVAKSDLFGCQYLHEHIPGVGLETGSGQRVRYILDGPVSGYRTKVYGPNYHGPVSPDEYGPEGNHTAWNLRQVYDNLWQRYGGPAVPVDMGPQHMQPLFGDPHGFVLNTIPAPALCRDMENHKFASQQIWAMGNTKYRDAEGLPFNAPDMTVVCNGHRDTRWYRAASVFGYCTLEWPGGAKPPITGVAAVSKPLSTDCTCWLSKRSVRLGRFGRWTKGVLVHTAYFDAARALP